MSLLEVVGYVALVGVALQAVGRALVALAAVVRPQGEKTQEQTGPGRDA